MKTSGLRFLSPFLAWPFALTLAAQDTPKVEVFGGYSHLRLTNDSGLEPADLNGWNASAKLNVTPRIGLLADFSGDYGQRTLAPYRLYLPIPGNPNPLIQTEPGDMHQHIRLRPGTSCTAPWSSDSECTNVSWRDKNKHAHSAASGTDSVAIRSQWVIRYVQS